MAGICGIILKNSQNKNFDYSFAILQMINKLSIKETQTFRIENSLNFYFGNVTLCNDSENKNFIHNLQLDIFCTIDGLVFVSNEEKDKVKQKYNIVNNLSDKEYLPFLFTLYGVDFVNKITGWYNIFLFDKKSFTGFLLNDRLGYSPLFYFESATEFIFASKIESILASGLFSEIEFDIASIAEHLFFNYIISDNTFIKGIVTLEPSSLIQFNISGFYNKNKYWNFEEFLFENPKSKKAGLDLLDFGFKKAISKLENYNSLNLSLTGGWDSRLVLSYLMPFREKIHLYSFGVKDAPDIIIPQSVASNEDIKYTPFFLDDDYLKNEFKKSASLTIEKSNGSRNYKRAHYIFAFELLSRISEISVSGIYGDEVLKVTGLKPGDVISKKLIDFICTDFDVKLLIESLKVDILKHGLVIEKEHLQEFEKRMLLLKKSVLNYKNLNEKFFHFRFLIILRKYFGAEVNSYNDFSYNFSPFIDFDFLLSYFKSRYCGVYYPFNSNSLFLKRQTTTLYCKLIQRNSVKLSQYISARGYAISDILRFKGNLKIIFKSIFNKKHFDPFNTKPTSNLFIENNIKSLLSNNHPILPINLEIAMTNKRTESLSLYFWLLKIHKRYISE